PVSSFVTFELFVRPFLARVLGHEDAGPDAVFAVLEEINAIKTIPRTQHLPAALSAAEDGRLRVRPLEWHGSADLRGFADANAMIVVEAGAAPPQPGAVALLRRAVETPHPAGRAA